MIDYRATEKLVVYGLQAWLKSKGHEIPVIAANQTAPIPDGAYLSYTITTPVVANMKGYAIAEDGARYKALEQVWSFTSHSTDDVEAFDIAMLAYDWFALAGNTYLSDNDIVAQRVGNIANRDNLLTIDYEYRRGFDVEFLLLHVIAKEDCETAGYIESIDIPNLGEV